MGNTLMTVALLIAGYNPEPKVNLSSTVLSLKGSWKVVAWQREGDEGEFAIGREASFDLEHLIISAPYQIAFLYTVDFAKARIDLRMIGQDFPGIYQWDGRQLKICYSPTKRPTKFVFSKGSDQSLLVLERPH